MRRNQYRLRRPLLSHTKMSNKFVFRWKDEAEAGEAEADEGPVFGLPELTTDHLIGPESDFALGDELVWGESPVLIEALFLGGIGDVRSEFIQHDPETEALEEDREVLSEMLKLYEPPSKALNATEEAFLTLMRDCIKVRLSQLESQIVL